MKVFVTGGAGFIGSNLVDFLLASGHDVVAYDNFSTGRRPFLAQALDHQRFRLVEGDLLDTESLHQAIQGSDFVFHLAANADVRFGVEHPRKDLEQNTIATFNVLEAMRIHGIKKIMFSSTGSVYGEAAVIPTPENAPFPLQTSLYGASKLAGESLIQAYCEGFGMQGWIFRFVSILGERYTHGHVYDFYQSLRNNPQQLKVLGNGLQRKSYLTIQDCLSAIQMAIEKSQERIQIFNLGTNEYCQVNDSIGWISEALSVQPERLYTGGDRGWIGDNPFIFLDTQKIQNLGWKPRFTIREGILKTLEFLQGNPWVYES